jgi:hypothetical protein
MSVIYYMKHKGIDYKTSTVHYYLNKGFTK